MLTRRAFAIGAGAAASASLLDPGFGRGEPARAVTRLPVPQLIDAAIHHNAIGLTVSAGHHEFYKGKPTRTYGYSGPILGPVLRFRRGDHVEMSVRNELGVATTVHWHGLLVPGDVDGGPQRKIEPGATWRPTLSIDQPAATLWYHPHPHHETGRQVYLGLAGLIIVEDGHDLGLPDQFGVDDLPLTIQDRVIDETDGSIGYDLSELDVVYGVRGDTVIVNGAITPTAHVPAGWVRPRLLNGSNARNFELRFQDGRTFHVIASDGGFLSRPVPMSVLRISPAERFEILVDFSGGQPVVLETGPDRSMGLFGAISDAGTDEYAPVMRFEVGSASETAGRLPSQLVEPAAIAPVEAVRRRSFVLNNGVCGQRTRMSNHDGMPALIGINGRTHDPNRIDAETKLGTSEIWEITSVGMAHPFHVHGALFRILSLDDKSPPDHLKGWKDVVLVEGKAELLVKFTKPAARGYPFMYHCHILEHEDAGMMAQYVCT
ncbi:multicopper oxidase domain-containing protein [Bradyrhizobium sp. WYCCWR 13023]|uniref:Multicopper oxidase CueO n=1 Tax=Bradyrhizobium zhengyangense TaxID=2911009 RepID=A0A9X1U974_9BRAD|nr:multicopper oxidase domain-containing protein [Bradyrhizobium zhengyangense]MCG2628516.1 multicopper oxidase domain-containing protein [Bradyrhizobium zhengyangense]